MTSPTTGGCTDVHAHVFPADLPDFATRFGEPHWPSLVRPPGDTARIMQDGEVYRPIDESYWRLEPRLRWMDGVGVDRQIVSPLPVLMTYWADPVQAHEFARRQNELIAELVAGAPDRLIGFGTVPLQDTELAIASMDEARRLGLAGLEIGTRAGSREFDDPEVRPFFEAAAALGVPLLLHPLEAEGLGRVDNRFVRFGIGVPADTGLTGAQMLISELLVELPNLRICMCHGGGSFFWSLPRMERILIRQRGSEVAERMLDGIRSAFVDTAGLGPSNVRFLLEHLPPDRLLLGSDFPAAAPDPLREVLAGAEFDAVRSLIERQNVDEFLTGARG